MLLLTKTILFYWDFLDVQSSSAKGNIAGIGKVKDWAEKLLSSKAIHSPKVSASSTSHSCASSLLNVTSFGVKGSTRSTHSSATQPLPTPASVSSRVVPVSYLGEDSELAEFRNYTQESISKGSNASTRVSIAVINNVHSPSISPPPPSQPHIIAKTAVSAKPVKSELSMYYDRLSSDKEVIEVDQVLTPLRGSLKWPLVSQADMEGHQSAAPLSKCTETKAEDGVIELPNCPRNNASSKFTDQDLPPGCQDGNVWHGIYIPSLAHWCGGYVNPWTIEAGDLQDAMQIIWDEVYCGKVEHYIAPRGPVFHVVRPF
ncbi:hypothetical protein F5J12DRAFT_893857 [Pisolithus orientalis]|uniref:uncharacterized protein n=1 Tax=Pisolithus orientalis TaxID=936130 RepID=UPI00222546A5|nr:uncharacterized protein F5J12DRAFT_893857 [Pisolithus orientalis]KAI6003230.1 hypothetical protein F5J12DRAFT_893857 [Pisolithus orientalis]